MDTRFQTVFDALIDERAQRGNFRAALARSTDDELVGALAVAGTRDALLANAIATELLNRLRRAPFLGACLVSLSFLLSIYGLDYAYTGTFLWLDVDSGVRAAILAGISFALTIVSAFLFFAWRGSFRALSSRLRRPVGRF